MSIWGLGLLTTKILSSFILNWKELQFQEIIISEEKEGHKLFITGWAEFKERAAEPVHYNAVFS